MASLSPTQRSLALLRSRGYTVAITEHWNPHARLRQDLFGFIDLIALRDGETLAVQTTSASNVAARVTKIGESLLSPIVLAAGWKIVVHGWRKLPHANNWVCREVQLSGPKVVTPDEDATSVGD